MVAVVNFGALLFDCVDGYPLGLIFFIGMSVSNQKCNTGLLLID